MHVDRSLFTIYNTCIVLICFCKLLVFVRLLYYRRADDELFKPSMVAIIEILLLSLPRSKLLWPDSDDSCQPIKSDRVIEVGVSIEFNFSISSSGLGNFIGPTVSDITAAGGLLELLHSRSDGSCTKEFA